MKAGGNALAGIVLVLAAGACFSTLDTASKYVVATTSIVVALWLRYLFQAVATAAAAFPLRGLAVLRTARPGFQLLRGALLATCSLIAVASLKVMPVAEFTAIVMITPLVITVLAATLLKERVSPLRWILVVGGFVGTLIIIRPDDDLFSWESLLPLALVACNASFQILTSRLARTEDAVTTHLYTGWIGTAMVTPALLVFGPAWPHSAFIWWLTVGMGLLGAVGHFALIQAYARTAAATLTPYLYAQVGFAILGGWLVFAHVPDRWALAGIALVTVCGALGAWLTVRESRVPIEPVEA